MLLDNFSVHGTYKEAGKNYFINGYALILDNIIE